jgi:hypothetical protein
MRHCDEIEVRSNLRILARERGKIVARREGHNIWLNLGREYLASVIIYTSYSPEVHGSDARVRYVGLGIGGAQQRMLSVANADPFASAYPGSNNQTDTDATVTRLERPVRVSGGSIVYPGAVDDVWLGLLQAPPTHPVPTQTRFQRLFTQLEVSYAPFLSVPLSEVMLFTSVASPSMFNNVGVAYDTFDSISKTSAISLELEWTLRF